MAWLDDRAWCHPKLVDLSNAAFRTWVNGISYSAGMGTRGVLTPQQQRLLGGNLKIKMELQNASLWVPLKDGSVTIKDWDDHNGKRDERRAADRERKRTSRRQSRGTSAGQSAGRSTGTARVEGSEGSEGKEPSSLQPELQDVEGRKEISNNEIDALRLNPIDILEAAR